MSDREPAEDDKKIPLEESAANINARLESIDESLKMLSGRDKDEKDKTNDKNSSRTAVALTFAAVGFKLGALFGGKIGALYGVATKDKEDASQPAGGAKQNIENKGMSMDARWIRQATIWGGIAGVIGAISAGALGWARGDRIDSASDLWKKPMESLGKILGPEPIPTKVENPKTAEKPVKQEASAVKAAIEEKPNQLSAQWRETVNQPQTQSSESTMKL